MAVVSRFLTWKQRRASILKQYVVAGQLKGAVGAVERRRRVGSGARLEHRRRPGERREEGGDDARLRDARPPRAARGDGESEGAHTVRLTQQELVSRVDKLNAELRKAWGEGGCARARSRSRCRRCSATPRSTVLPVGLRPRHRDARQLRCAIRRNSAQFSARCTNSPRNSSETALRPPAGEIGVREGPRQGGRAAGRRRRLHARADARGGRRDDEELVHGAQFAYLAQFYAIRRNSLRRSTRWRRSASSSPLLRRAGDHPLLPHADAGVGAADRAGA